MMNLSRCANVFAVLALIGVSACASAPKTADNDSDRTYRTEQQGGIGFPNIFGSNSDNKPKPSPAPNSVKTGIGVNSYLWRSTLDTLAFMPLVSADPWGGIVLTDWYVNPEKPAERFKATIYILDARLRADALKVTVFKQVKDASGAWVDAPVSGQTETDIENAILTKARLLHLSDVH